MTREEAVTIRKHISQLSDQAGDFHNMANALASQEAAMAELSGGEYQNDRLTASKQSLVDLAGNLIKAAETLVQALKQA